MLRELALLAALLAVSTAARMQADDAMVCDYLLIYIFITCLTLPQNGLDSEPLNGERSEEVDKQLAANAYSSMNYEDEQLREVLSGKYTHSIHCNIKSRAFLVRLRIIM